MSCELMLLRPEDDSEGGVGGSRSIPAPGEEVDVGESVVVVWVMGLLFVEDLRPKLLVQELLREVETSGGLATGLSAEFDVDDDAGGGSLRERVRRNAFKEEDAMDDSGLDLTRGFRGLSTTVHSFSWLVPSSSFLGLSIG